LTDRRENPPGMGFLGAAAIVFRMAVAVGLLALLGDWVDRSLHTAPWFLTAGIVLGVVVVFIDLRWRAGGVRRRRRKAGGKRRET